MDRTDSTLYSWQVHPARERGGTALLTAGFIALVAWLVIELMEQPAWGVFAVTVLGAGCNRFFLPTKYQLDEEGISARYPLRTVRYEWTELRRFLYDSTGGFLSPRVRRSLLDEYRGISLLFPITTQPKSPLTLTLSPEGRGDKAEQIIAEEIIQEIRSRLPAAAVIREISSKTALTREGSS